MTNVFIILNLYLVFHYLIMQPINCYKSLIFIMFYFKSIFTAIFFKLLHFLVNTMSIYEIILLYFTNQILKFRMIY